MGKRETVSICRYDTEIEEHERSISESVDTTQSILESTSEKLLQPFPWSVGKCSGIDFRLLLGDKGNPLVQSVS